MKKSPAALTDETIKQLRDKWIASLGYAPTEPELNVVRIFLTSKPPAAAEADKLEPWIPVEDKLPGEQGHDSEEVLCFINGHCSIHDMECRQGGAWGIRLGWYDADKGGFRVHGRPEYQVTHWAPLPDAPARDAAMSASEEE